MKKLAFLLMAAAMCGTLGCDTDISNEEISDVLTPETRCLMTGGIPLTSAQVEQVRQTLNSPEAYFDYEKKPLDISSGMNIVNVYRSTYQYSAANPQNDSDFYCACGADICDKGVGCTQSSGYATCSAVSLNTDINAECDPVKVDNRYFGYLLSSHLFPILRQVAGLRSIQTKASNQDFVELEKIVSLLSSDHLKKLLSEGNNEKALVNSYVNSLDACVKDASRGKCAEIAECENKCADAMVASLFYASIAECMNNKTDHCPDGMQLTVEGADSSQSKSETYYKMLREIAGHLIATEDDAEIDKFLIDQVIYINNATANLAGLMSNSQELVNIQQYLFAHPEDPTSVEPRLEGGKVYLKPTHFSHATAKAVTTALKSFLAGAYGRIDDEARYEAHRKFFAHFILRSMSNADKSNLFSLTFVQRKQCQDVTSPAGRDTGYMQYCYSEAFSEELSNQSVAELFTKLIPEGIKGEDAAAALADGIIMDTSFSTVLNIDNTDKTIALDLSDESGNNVLTIGEEEIENKRVPKKIKGEWKSYRCAMGASCNTDSECGVCTNSNVKITRVDATGKKHDNATCVAGDLVYTQSGGNAPDPVQETPCEDGTIGCITEGGFSFLAQCENGTYLKDDNMYFYHKCFNGCNETRDGCMNDYSCSTEEIGKVKCFFDYRFGQLATVLGECKKGEDGTPKYDIVPSSIAGCANKACNKEMTACVDPMGESKPEDNKCTEGDVKCIKDKDKAYLATCKGGEYKYDDSNACISNDCNDDNTNCYYDTKCTESDVGQTQCVYLNSNYGLGTIEMTCKKNGNEYIYTMMGSNGKPKICQNGCSDNKLTCKENNDPKDNGKETGKCTKKGEVKCIKDKDKAYLATCNGSEYKYDDSNACISNDCNDDNTNCYYKTACKAADVDKTQCAYLYSKYGGLTSVQMTCQKLDDSTYSYTDAKGMPNDMKVCQNGCSDDGLKCK